MSWEFQQVAQMWTEVIGLDLSYGSTYQRCKHSIDDSINKVYIISTAVT